MFAIRNVLVAVIRHRDNVMDKNSNNNFNSTLYRSDFLSSDCNSTQETEFEDNFNADLAEASV